MNRALNGFSRLWVIVLAAAFAAPLHAQPTLPTGFTSIEMSPPLFFPVAMAFAPDGRIFVAERSGAVKVVQNGVIVSTFIDLSQEISAHVLSDRGLLGLALDPNFLTNHYVYLCYVVDPVFGPPDEGPNEGTYSRLTRYTGTVASNGNIADPASRTILIGTTPATAIPCCEDSHTVGALRFGADGSLLVSCGDSAHYNFMDAGNNSPSCILPGAGFFGPEENIGSFRSQRLDSLDGKLMRIDPATGNGLPGNPYYNAATPATARSRTWVSGLRNPFRFNRRPGTGNATHPGTLYIGDVGWNTHEEVSISKVGGENMGWPCYEGFVVEPQYNAVDLPDWDCATLGTPSNPGAVTPPIITMHHGNSLLSVPPGFPANAVIAGAFHTSNTYPSPWRNGFFLADFISGAIRVLRTDANDQFAGMFHFGQSSDGVVDFAIDPVTGDLCILTMYAGVVYRVHSNIKPGDVSRDNIVNVTDLLGVIGAWGPCANLATCPADLNADGVVNVTDLLEVIGNWG